MLNRLKRYLKQRIAPDLRYRIFRTPARLEKLGSAYGGWIIPVDLLDENAICYLAGAGEDISFDTSLAKRCHCPVFIFDPTPRSRVHFDLVLEAARTGKPLSITAHEQYDIDEGSARRLRFIPIGIWKHADTVKFFAPKDETHISHSISNLQNTGAYFEARVERLRDIMQSNHHDRLDLLKLDIEGAEFEVIDSILEDKIKIRILCVEFHKEEGQGYDRIQSAIDKLAANNYRVIARENMDLTFINTSYTP